MAFSVGAYANRAVQHVEISRFSVWGWDNSTFWDGAVQRGIAPRKKDGIKSKIGKGKKLKCYVTEEAKNNQNKCCGFKHEM